jgi:hypothetical protein
MSVLGDKEYENFIKNEYLPFYNSLNEKEKTFWLDCSKEELIDHFIANVKNGEVLLQRIDKAIEYIKEHIRVDDEYPDYMEMLIEERNELLEILGDKENE